MPWASKAQQRLGEFSSGEEGAGQPRKVNEFNQATNQSGLPEKKGKPSHWVSRWVGKSKR